MKYRRSLTMLVVLNLVTYSAFAETWLVFPNQNLNARQTQERTEEFKKIHPNKIVISAFEGLQHEDIGSKKLTQLKDLFEKAEDAFFANNFAQSKNIHSQFSQSILETHFRGGVKTYLIRSLVRQSQLQSDATATLELLSQAVSLDPHFLPQKFGFSPSVSESWNKAVRMRPKKAIPIQIQLPSNGIVFLDGQKLNFIGIEKTYSIREGFHHLAVLVPNSRWVIKTLDVKAPSVETVILTPLVSGTCEKSFFLGGELPSGIEAAAFFENGCSVVFKNETGTPTIVQHDGPVELPSRYKPDLKSDLAREFEKPPSAFEKTMKSPWLWAAVVTVVAGVLIHQSQNESGRVVPVHTNH